MEQERLDEIIKGITDSLTEEQKKKASECRTAEDLIKLAAAEGIEFPDEILQEISAGKGCIVDRWGDKSRFF